MWMISVVTSFLEFSLLQTCPEHYRGALWQRMDLLVFLGVPVISYVMAYFLMRYDPSLVSLCLGLGMVLAEAINQSLSLTLSGPTPSGHGYIEQICNPYRARAASIEATVVFFQLTFYFLYHSRIFPGVVTNKRNPVTRISLLILTVISIAWVISARLLPLRTPGEIVSGALVGYFSACVSAIFMRFILDPWIKGGLIWLRRLMCIGANTNLYYSTRQDHDPSFLSL